MASQGFIQDSELGGETGWRACLQGGGQGECPPSPKKILNLDPLRLLLTQSGTKLLLNTCDKTTITILNFKISWGGNSRSLPPLCMKPRAFNLCVCMYICTYVRTYVCMYVFMYVVCIQTPNSEIGAAQQWVQGSGIPTHVSINSTWI